MRDSMATVKDIARIAGVSHGTVSNVLNGRQGVAIDKARRVQEAVRVLGYVPDGNARSLKTSKTRSVAVILPNIVDPHFAQLFTGIERILAENGYSVGLFITAEIVAKEDLVLEQILRQRFDGVVIATCQPEARACFERLNEKNVKIVFVEREHADHLYNFAFVDTYAAVRSTIEQLLSGGMRDLALVAGPQEYTSEREAVRAFTEAHAARSVPIAPDRILVTNYDREGAFRAAIRLLQSSGTVDAILATSTQMIEGVTKAYAIGTSPERRKPTLISLSEDSWTGGACENVIKVGRPSIKLGEVAAELLLANFSHPFFQPQRLRVEILATPNHPGSPAGAPLTRTETVRVLALRGSGAEALRALLPDFRTRSNIEVEIETLEYEELYEAIRGEKEGGRFDVFQVDTPWLQELVQQGQLLRLDDYLERNPHAVADFIPGILETYARYEDHYYALPYLFDTQLLFYRKDLLEDVGDRRQFYELHRAELRVPQSWQEFNAVARFFSRAHNPDSPVPFGTTAGGRFSSGAVCEFLPRQWGFGGESFDEAGRVTLDSPECVRALESYAETFQYASPPSAQHYWDEQVTEFLAGDAAMMILFFAHATRIADRSISKVAGKIGYALVPGKTGLLGGWSLGINSTSRRPEAAFSFLSWATGKEMAIPSTVLGASTSSVSLYKSSELLEIYPWLPKALESFRHNRRRWLPACLREAGLTEREFEKIVGHAVHSCVAGELSAAAALKEAADRLRQYRRPDSGRSRKEVG